MFKNMSILNLAAGTLGNGAKGLETFRFSNPKSDLRHFVSKR